MIERETRVWLLMRGISPTESILFPVIVAVEEDEPALFGATVAGMEGRLAAVGRSEQEAEVNALDLFRDIVDNALNHKVPLSQELGSAIGFQRLPVPVQAAGKIFDLLEKMVAKIAVKELGEGEGWRLVPTTDGFIRHVTEAVSA